MAVGHDIHHSNGAYKQVNSAGFEGFRTRLAMPTGKVSNRVRQPEELILARLQQPSLDNSKASIGTSAVAGEPELADPWKSEKLA